MNIVLDLMKLGKPGSGSILFCIGILLASCLVIQSKVISSWGSFRCPIESYGTEMLAHSVSDALPLLFLSCLSHLRIGYQSQEHVPGNSGVARSIRMSLVLRMEARMCLKQV